jgi:hypothetical protein
MQQSTQLLPCDGCGQLADSRHIARRLQRLEWTSRFRPIHIQTLVLSGISPRSDDEFLYAPRDNSQGEAQKLLSALEISTEAKTPDLILAEVQKLGLLLTHILECPLSNQIPSFEVGPLLENQLASAITRIRRSLKPRRVVLIAAELLPLAEKLHQSNLGCPILPAARGVFLSSATTTKTELESFAAALGHSHVQTV